jgi:multiple antibiotic resistance protein
MESLNLADTFVTFLALIGPQKVLLSFGRLARTLDDRSVRAVAGATAVATGCVGVLCALRAPWIATFFHIGAAELNLAAGLLFIIYAVGMVLGVLLVAVGVGAFLDGLTVLGVLPGHSR